jgi:nicotinate-nucleotide adenylyltransferase
MRRHFPLAYPGQKIGLFGGSFDPAHAGHTHVAETALKRLGLDRVWWLVAPQNPLKPKSGPFANRFASARAQAKGRRMLVTDLESQIGSGFT